MEKIEALKALMHPLISFLLVAAWIAFIGNGVETPLEFDSLAITAAGTWVLKRSYKTIKEVAK